MLLLMRILIKWNHLVKQAFIEQFAIEQIMLFFNEKFHDQYQSITTVLYLTLSENSVLYL